ncbi:hypothetical protein BU17DRAFT_98497 [Hysterangium stoloniferum]|nr:hypothetical protein BU17DRAFT_98497 [Hysterangium stoloniferum]
MSRCLWNSDGSVVDQQQLFIVAAYIVKTFDITPAKDADGKDIPIPGTYTRSAFVETVPFKCSIKPRSGTEKLTLKN